MHRSGKGWWWRWGWATFGWGCLAQPLPPGLDPEVSVSAGVSPAALAWSSAQWEPGLGDVEWSVGTQGARSATLWVPEAAPPRSLVVFLHGAIVKQLGMRKWDPQLVARSLVSCLVAPALTAIDPLIIAPHSPDGRWWEKRDTEFVLGVVAAARQRWPGLEHRIVIMGYSNGGISTWYFARLYPDYFSAAIPMAFNDTIVGASPLPIYAIQGDKDELFPIEPVRAAIRTLRAGGSDVTLEERHRAGHMDVCAYRTELTRAAQWLEQHAFRRRGDGTLEPDSKGLGPARDPVGGP